MKDNLENLEEESEEIKRRLQINKSKATVRNELLDSLRRPISLFSNNGPCGSVQLEPYPNRYFIAQEFNDNKDDLRKSIEDALNRFGFTSIAANDFYLSEKLICKIAALIQATPFGVYQLSTSQNRNVYLELGIAVGLGRSFILVKDKDADPANIVRDIEYYQINDYLDVQYELGDLLEEYMTSIGRYRPNETPHDRLNNNAVIYHGDAESIDITIVVAKQIKNSGFTPVILGKFQEKLARYLRSEAEVEPKFIESRDQIIEAIQISKFGVFRVHNSASADNFVALGVSIGLNKPFLPIKHVGENMPTDLLYLPSFDYAGYTNLETRLNLQFKDWLVTIEKQGFQ